MHGESLWLKELPHHPHMPTNKVYLKCVILITYSYIQPTPFRNKLFWHLMLAVLNESHYFIYCNYGVE
jgi:hypothetical protein